MLHKNDVWLAQLVSNFMKPGKMTSWLTNWLNNNKYNYFLCYHRLSMCAQVSHNSFIIPFLYKTIIG